MVLTKYQFETGKLDRDLRIVMLSDYHNVPYCRIVERTRAADPDLILVVGDLVDRHRKTYRRVQPFLRECVAIAPTFFSYGNHEVKFPVLSAADFRSTGVTLLDNSWAFFDGLCIGGYTPYTDDRWIDRFEQQEGYRILMTHEPEYFFEGPMLRNRQIDLILAGHVHGGQIRLPDGRGLFAPEQGLFAKYVHGKYGNMVVGAGLSNTARPLIPRLNNPTEIVQIDLLGVHRS